MPEFDYMLLHANVYDVLAGINPDYIRAAHIPHKRLGDRAAYQPQADNAYIAPLKRRKRLYLKFAAKNH